MKSIRLYVAAFAVSGISVFFAGCSSNSGGGSSNSSTDLSSAAGVLKAASQAIQSAGFQSSSFVGSSKPSKGIRTLASIQSSNDPLCSNNGEPWDSDLSAVMLSNHAEYAERVFHCKVNGNVVESVDTIAGSFAQNASIMCSVYSHFGIDSSDFGSSAAELVTVSPATIPLTTSCWPQGRPVENSVELTEVQASSVTVQALAANTGYEFEIRMALVGLGNIRLKWFNKDSRFGVAKIEEAEGAEGVGSITQITVDSQAGVLLLNAFDDRDRNDVYRSVSRFRASGDLNANYQFTTINEGKAYNLISGSGMADAADATFTFSAVTVVGQSTGAQFKLWSDGENDGQAPVAGAPTCNGDCTGLADVGAAAGMEALIRRDNTVKAAWATYIDSGLPMCDSGTSTVNYDAVPSSLGAFGVCP